MASVSTYLNFERNTEEAFNFYKSVFGGEFGKDFQRLGETPPQPGMPSVPADDANLIMHVSLPILGGKHVLQGTDAPESMGFHLVKGNNMHICLNYEKLEEAQEKFSLLSAGGKVDMPLQKMFWGDYFASFSDQFGVHWMINCKD